MKNNGKKNVIIFLLLVLIVIAVTTFVMIPKKICHKETKIEKIDVIGFSLIRQFYFSFGHTDTKYIPFFDDNLNFEIRN